jgi:hypothetical protein
MFKKLHVAFDLFIKVLNPVILKMKNLYDLP